MKMNESVKYWMDLAEYDFESAKVMLNGGRYLYVGFMCHQTIEKALKAVISNDCADDEIPPKIHNLQKLAENAELFTKMSENQKEILRKLNPLNIEARYPKYKSHLAGNLTGDICQEFIVETEGLLCWIKERL
jgi:HEPN domain-containing protein